MPRRQFNYQRCPLHPRFIQPLRSMGEPGRSGVELGECPPVFHQGTQVLGVDCCHCSENAEFLVQGTTSGPTYKTLHAAYDFSAYCNGTGFLSVSYSPHLYSSTSAWVEAVSDIGISYVKDLKTGLSAGATRIIFTVKDGKRASAYDAYYVLI